MSLYGSLFNVGDSSHQLKMVYDTRADTRAGDNKVHLDGMVVDTKAPRHQSNAVQGIIYETTKNRKNVKDAVQKAHGPAPKTQHTLGMVPYPGPHW